MISFIVDLRPFSLRSTNNMSDPADARDNAIALPIPLAAPDTTDTFPVRSNIEVSDILSEPP
jgi:hypothetical protein